MAKATGNLKVITDAMVKSVKVDEQGKVTGVTYVDKHSVTEHAIDADVVILAASACESARILLNSTSQCCSKVSPTILVDNFAFMSFSRSIESSRSRI